MKISLYQRLSFALLVVFIAMFLLFIFWWQHVASQARQESQQHLHISLAANLARDNPLLQQGVYDHEALKNLFHTLMVLGPAFEFYYIDTQGKILTHSVSPLQVKREEISLLPIRTLIENTAKLPIYGDDPRHINRQRVFSAAPIFNGSELQGYLYVIVAGEQYQDIFDRVSKNKHIEASILLVIAAFILLFSLMLCLFRRLTQPIRSLNKQMQTFEAIGFDIQKITLSNPLQTGDEVSDLTIVFENMAKKIHQQFQQLSLVDKQRKLLMIEISHDLRTPLARLKGYLETMALKGDALCSNDREHYLDVALKSATQLSLLIDQIFELSHLESGQAAVHQEHFNLTELVYDVMAKFSLKAEKNSLELAADIKDKNVFVYSDIGKVERILSNLIENALRHTSAGGKINLIVSESEENQWVISVNDNGSGIKKSEINYIFDARYRASNATKGKHAGLGLAICKKLALLLHTDIKVHSKLGEGTRFSFSLRKT